MPACGARTLSHWVSLPMTTHCRLLSSNGLRLSPPLVVFCPLSQYRCVCKLDRFLCICFLLSDSKSTRKSNNRDGRPASAYLDYYVATRSIIVRRHSIVHMLQIAIDRSTLNPFVCNAVDCDQSESKLGIHLRWIIRASGPPPCATARTKKP